MADNAGNARQFTTINEDIRCMNDWLKEYAMEDVCMESTGKYLLPIYDILEQNGLKPILTHPKYVKQAKRRKTDFRDFQMDFVLASFIPRLISWIYGNSLTVSAQADLYEDFRKEAIPEFYDCLQGVTGFHVL